ncbi:hypothetical protein RRF57_008048 [Xylaria bambusicola]|uniref:Uncharacterized protein n=1 Tax=Xylaria bambusicola TaxID=326684 RepID=A0AAN7URF3_9PEZI
MSPMTRKKHTRHNRQSISQRSVSHRTPILSMRHKNLRAVVKTEFFNLVARQFGVTAASALLGSADQDISQATWNVGLSGTVIVAVTSCRRERAPRQNPS